MGATLLFGAGTSHCGGFSCCTAQALGCTGFTSCGSQALEHRLGSCGTQAYRGFPRQEYWSGLPFPPPGDLPDPGSKVDLVHKLGAP